MVSLPLNVPPAPIQDETYLLDGTLNLINARKSLQLPNELFLTGSVCRWLYSLFLAIDANFRLKLKTRAIKDPELGSGLAYFVDTIKFQKHLKDSVPTDEVSPLIPRF